jgi:inosine-uridine nucleoside N-ribohydrolase
MKDIIIDTDIGDDVDDAYALAFALCSPELNLKAVTTVFGNVEIRTKLALKLLKTFGREDVPVAKGVGKPLLERTFRARASEEIPNQAVVLAQGERLPKPSPKHAVDLITSMVMDAQNEFTIVSIGPLTNIAMALMKEPRLKEKAKLVMMGGVVSKPQAEHNIRCDPEAARMVFESGIPITMVGLDVTTKCPLSQEDVSSLRKRGLATTDLLADMTSAFMENASARHGRKVYPILHDPLAVAVSFKPDLVKTQPMLVKVETRGEFTRGFTVAVSESEKPNAQVCVDVDSKRFIRLFMNRILSAVQKE